MTPASDLPALRTPVKEPAPADATGAAAKRKARAPDQIFGCRLAYALAARRAIDGADERANHIRPIYCAILCEEGARRPIDAAVVAHGYLEATSDRGNPRRIEFLRRVGYRRSYQATAAGPSVQTWWAPGFFEVEPPANLDLEDAEDEAGPLVRLCSMPPLADLREAGAADPRRWSEALAWVADLGLEGPAATDPRFAALGPAAAWWCAQLDRRVAAPMLHDARFQAQVLLSAARSSARNGLLLPRSTWRGGGAVDRSSGAIALWAGGSYGGGEEWGRGDKGARSDGEHFGEHGLRARDFGLSDPILTIARDGALRYLLARECRAFEAAAKAAPEGRRAAYDGAVAFAEEERLVALAAKAEARKSKRK